MKKYNYKCKNCGYIMEVESDEEMLPIMIVKCLRCDNQVFEKVPHRKVNKSSAS